MDLHGISMALEEVVWTCECGLPSLEMQDSEAVETRRLEAEEVVEPSRFEVNEVVEMRRFEVEDVEDHLWIH